MQWPKTWENCRINMKGLSSYPNVPLAALHRKGTEGATVHVASPKSHNFNLTKTIRSNESNSRV